MVALWKQNGIETFSVLLAGLFLVVLSGVTLSKAIKVYRFEPQVISTESIIHTRPKASINMDALFGAYQSQAIQETRLNVKLTGVFATLDPRDGSAVISAQGQKPKLYTVGDSLPGGGQIVEVHSTHIVLEQAGEQSTLSLPQKTL